MKSVLYRIQQDDKQTLGVLVAQRLDKQLFICKTLELSWKNNEESVSCIPADKYNVIWTYSPKYRKNKYLISNVPNRTGIRIHAGNYFEDIEGCILLGSAFKDINADMKLDIVHSGYTLDAFETFMQKEAFKLIIKDPEIL